MVYNPKKVNALKGGTKRLGKKKTEEYNWAFQKAKIRIKNSFAVTTFCEKKIPDDYQVKSK